MPSISANCPVLNLTMLSVSAGVYRDHLSFHQIIEAFTPKLFPPFFVLWQFLPHVFSINVFSNLKMQEKENISKLHQNKLVG